MDKTMAQQEGSKWSSYRIACCSLPYRKLHREEPRTLPKPTPSFDHDTGCFDSSRYPQPATKTIRLAPQFSVAALKANLGKELSMWYCLRAVNHWGSGRLDMVYAAKSLIADFGYSRSTAYRILDTGDGVFWSLQQSKIGNRLQIRIYGLTRITRYFSPFIVADISSKYPLRSLWAIRGTGSCTRGLGYKLPFTSQQAPKRSQYQEPLYRKLPGPTYDHSNDTTKSHLCE